MSELMELRNEYSAKLADLETVEGIASSFVRAKTAFASSAEYFLHSLASLNPDMAHLLFETADPNVYRYLVIDLYSNKIEAIKTLRKHYSGSLGDCKNVVENMDDCSPIILKSPF